MCNPVQPHKRAIGYTQNTNSILAVAEEVGGVVSMIRDSGSSQSNPPNPIPSLIPKTNTNNMQTRHKRGLMEKQAGGNNHQAVKEERIHSTRGLCPCHLYPKAASALTLYPTL